MGLEQIITLTFGAILLIIIAIFFFKKKDYFKYSSAVKPILTLVLNVLKSVGGLMPNNSIINTMVQVISAAVSAAGHAEKLWLEGCIDKTARPECAENYIKSILEDAGIEITDNIQTIINGTIAITCYLMPHYNTENKEEEC